MCCRLFPLPSLAPEQRTRVLITHLICKGSSRWHNSPSPLCSHCPMAGQLLGTRPVPVGTLATSLCAMPDPCPGEDVGYLWVTQATAGTGGLWQRVQHRDVPAQPQWEHHQGTASWAGLCCPASLARAQVMLVYMCVHVHMCVFLGRKYPPCTSVSLKADIAFKHAKAHCLI